MQVHFSWDAQGKFAAVFDLPTPVLRPRWEEHATDGVGTDGPESENSWREKSAKDEWWIKWWECLRGVGTAAHAMWNGKKRYHEAENSS